MSLLSSLASAKPRPQLPAPGVAFSLLGESLDHRRELASLEVVEARDHAIVLLLGFAITLLVASIVWDGPHRVAWMVGVCLVYGGGAVGSGSLLLKRLRTWHPLQETQSQLEQDFQCLSKLIKSVLP